MRRFLLALGPAIAVIVAVIVYWRTAFPSISWWENGELAAAASVLGVVHPPGSLIPTIAGWLFLKIPLGFSPAFQLNILASIVAVGVVAVTMVVAVRLAGGIDHGSRISIVSATVTVMCAGLAFAFCRTVWYNGTIFTPYIFTALLTAITMWALTRWWETVGTPAALSWMFIIFLLVGLDLSVHRTNALLIPGLGAAFLLRQWRTIISWRAWLAGIAGLAVGLSFYLILMPMAAAHPPLNANDPSTWGRFWDYFSLKQYGGSFLVSVYPRNGNFWSDQVMDYLTGFRDNFANMSGPLGPFGVLPLLLGIIGALSLWLRRRRLAIAMVVLFLFTSLGAIIYFNVPAHYFRAMDRHYLPSFVIFGIFMISGALATVRWFEVLKLGRIAAVAFLVLLLVTPISQLTSNFRLLNNADTYFAYDTGQNLLNSLPENSIIFVGGDSDTYELWYLQEAEHQRPDVTVLNISLLNTQWYVRQMQEEDTVIGYKLSDSELAALGPAVWADTTIAVPLARNFVSEDGNVIDSGRIHFPPTMQDKYVLGHDVMIRRILQGNAWRRPVYASSFAFGQIGWLWPYSRSEGIVRQIMPYVDPKPDTRLMEQRLLTEYSLRGYADTARVLEFMTQGIGRGYWSEMFPLLQTTQDVAQRVRWRDQMQTRVPLDRVGASPEMINGLNAMCSPPPDAK